MKPVAYVKRQTPPIVLKADGLAAGKGVVIAQTVDEALPRSSPSCRTKRSAQRADKVVIEEYLTGREMSLFVFTDGTAISRP